MTSKKLSREHEEFVAKSYAGTRSPSSGAASTDGGDVRNHDALFECKLQGEPGGRVKGGLLVRNMEKIADEAWEEGRQPVLCLRYWNPSSVLSDSTGWIDLTVRLTRDDSGN